MRQKLPYRNFSWIEKWEIELIEKHIMEIDADGDIGYIFEVDLDYPDDLHDMAVHQSLPLIPERREITADMLSPWQRKSAEDLGISLGGEKLVTSLFDKKKEKIHIKALQQAISLGMKLKKIYRGLKFEQRDYLRPYIEMVFNILLIKYFKNHIFRIQS